MNKHHLIQNDLSSNSVRNKISRSYYIKFRHMSTPRARQLGEIGTTSCDFSQWYDCDIKLSNTSSKYGTNKNMFFFFKDQKVPTRHRKCNYKHMPIVRWMIIGIILICSKNWANGMHYVDIVRWSNTILIYLSKWRFNVLIKTVFLEMFITVN